MAMANPGRQECRQNALLPARLIDQIRVKIAMPAEVYAQAVQPVIVAYAAHVHSQSRAQPGRPDSSDVLLLDSLTVAGLALDYRRGCILPPNAAPEDIGERAHRWTYAVWVTALLYRELAYRGGVVRSADASSLKVDSGDTAKPVVGRLRSANELLAHPLSIFRRIVPLGIQDWIDDDKALLGEIHGFLSGDPAAREGPLGLLVARAVTEFTRRHNAVTTNPEVTTDAAVQVAEPITAIGQRPQAVPVSGTVYPGAGSEHHQLAKQFMRWVGNGITNGSIRINDAAALVHFVEEGMLLVTPRIFKEFARQFGENGAGAVSSVKMEESRIGMAIQNELLKAGWHQPASNGNNIQTYDVVRHRRHVSSLCGVLITSPERFVSPAPAVNPLLVRVARL